MSLSKEYIRNFVEVEHKDDVILVTCDNEHKFVDHSANNPPIIWDWDNDAFKVLESNMEIIDQLGNPVQLTSVSLGEIQFLTAYVDMVTALKFIDSNVTDKNERAISMKFLNKLKPSMMAPDSLRVLNPNVHRNE